MQLYLTPLSHFSRKVRILLDLYEIPYDPVEIGNIAQPDLFNFGGNPLDRIPVLQDGKDWLIESDHIAEYLVNRFDASDRYSVHCSTLLEQNIRAILNGIMTEEVTYLIAGRMDVPVEQYRFFKDAMNSIQQGISWLETNAVAFNQERPGYREFHLVCALEHLSYFNYISVDCEKLSTIVKVVGENPIVRRSSPWVLRPKKKQNGV